MLHTKFHGNRPPVQEEKIFEGFFTIYGRHGSHLGHLTSIISTNFHFHEPKSLNTNFDKKRPSDF